MSTTTSARVMATDEKTGRKYVKTQTIEGAAVTVTKFSGEEVGGSYRWTSATYDVIAPGGEVFAGAIKWDGKAFKVGTKPAASLSKAVRAVLGTEQLAAPRKPSTRTRKSAATRKPKAAPKAAEVSGSSVIEADPETNLPRIKPGVQDKADAIVAAQLARNAEAGK
jgi:hypothetical protein